MSGPGLHPVHGHGPVLRSLARARLAGTLPSAMLIHGDTGVGKQRVGLWLAQLLLCEAPDTSGPCGVCRACRLTLRVEHPDLHWHFPLARPRGATTPEKLADKLEEARGAELVDLRAKPLRPSWSEEPRAHYLAAAQTLRRRAHQRPSMAPLQVFLIADAETLVPQESSPEAANALLKLLEEPPGGSRFILTSSEPGRLLATIRSRCLPLHLPGLGRGEVERFLVERAGAAPEDARKAAALAHGSIGRALGFLPGDGEPGPLESLRLEAFSLLGGAFAPRGGAAFAAGLAQRPAGARGLLDLFGFVEGWLRDVAAQAAGAEDAVVNRDRAGALQAWARGVDPERAATALELVAAAREQAQGNVNPQLIVAGLLLGLRRHLRPAPAVGP